MGDVHHCSGLPAASEMTYTVSSGTLTLLYHAIFSEFNSEKNENWPTFAEVIVKIKVIYLSRHGVVADGPVRKTSHIARSL